jgi:hypothetical protein
VRIRSLTHKGALSKAKQKREFISPGERASYGIKYSYHGYAITCENAGQMQSLTPYPGDAE